MIVNRENKAFIEIMTAMIGFNLLCIRQAQKDKGSIQVCLLLFETIPCIIPEIESLVSVLLKNYHTLFV